ncbi:MAG: hypothetical protein QNJ54_01495 [Prochloraceae cyanobacterium]|nr:hypothetical protein [Prochloraceae cyanobacterium]
MIDNFSIELARQLIESYEDFPVDFDLLWQWVGYSRKDKGKEMLVKNFEEGIDYRLHQIRETRANGSFSHYWEKIELTTGCAKEFGMLAQTDNGRLVRKYFIAAEKELKDSQQQQKKLSHIDLCYNLAKSVMESAQAMKALDRRVTQNDRRIAVIEQHREQALEELEKLPRSIEPASPLTERDKINEIIRAVAQRDSIPYGKLWNKAYKQLYYREHYDARTRAKNSGLSQIEQVEKDGMTGKLYAISKRSA